jgi:ABC-type polysaccharide/polyol phosphate transport system ATPase subunit
MKKPIANGSSVVIVSHDLERVLDLADRAMWLDHGRSVMTGDPRNLIDAYQHSIKGA